ncbi:hypothetical protein [Mucilaginibacter gilvus]|uniref:tRNA (Guanine-N1)-methyltransferase n=1 Tax=Mucilaginibacter gilvus TaxID=2305909 RepID=A0A3S4YHV7_9SPHI|nr:hypothetical protein [Mucilaginibacter gilvus]RWY55496.1 hypothetical protein EPL05_03730 [Mucilaginibacter gilvus]
MIKLLKSTAIILTLLLISSAGTIYAQDSTAKAKPAALKPVSTKPATVKPPVKYNPYAAKPVVKAPNLPATQTPATTGAAVVKPVQQYVPENPALLNDKSLNGQYQYLLTKVYNYQRPLVSALWKNVSDTLSATRRKLNEASSKLSIQTKTTDSLMADIKAKEETLSASNARVDSVSLLGMPLTKATYNWIMWGLVVGFGAIAVIVIARSGAHSREASYRIKLYNELEEDYKTYKAKANEKEKKLARELQTERNRLDELLGKG